MKPYKDKRTMETHAIYGQVLLDTYPSVRGFLSRYLLCLTPVVLAGISVLVLTYLQAMLTASSASVVNSLETIVPELPAFIEITVLLIAPVGIFLFFIYIGDVTNHPEISTGAALTIILSGIGAFSMVLMSGLPTVTTPFLLSLFRWIAYLVQPASIVATVLVLIGTELFRRSVRYTLFGDLVRITGGVWTPVEHLIAYSQIGKIRVKQNWFNRLIHVGSIVFTSAMYHGMEPGRTDSIGLPGTESLLSGYTIILPESVHSPLDCLYGITYPEKAKELLEQKILQK
jgi:hypothetical protein